MRTAALIVLVLFAGLTVNAQKKEINQKTSTVVWTGTKIGGSHTGEIKVKSGYFTFKGDQIVNGEVLMDMHSITDTDLSNEAYNQQLVGHLKSDDFFGVEKFPTAQFVVTKASKFNNGKASVSGNLTIKGHTEAVNFVVSKKEKQYETTLEVDRSKFDVRYGSKTFFSNIGDKAIGDIFTLNIRLEM